MNFDYYYTNEAEQFNFYRIPKVLFTDPRFSKLSVEAKVLYGLLLDRMSLSLKNDWIDEDGKVYIYFKLDFNAIAAKILCEGVALYTSGFSYS